MRGSKTLSVLALLAVLVAIGCGNPEKSASGFRLPDGDVEQGREAFVRLECNSCHVVSGIELPVPAVSRPDPILLGGDRPQVMTDGQLVTSIIHPSHRILRGYPDPLVQSGGKSKMPTYDELTVRELIDLVAFLHRSYEVLPPPVPNY